MFCGRSCCVTCGYLLYIISNLSDLVLCVRPHTFILLTLLISEFGFFFRVWTWVLSTLFPSTDLSTLCWYPWLGFSIFVFRPIYSSLYLFLPGYYMYIFWILCIRFQTLVLWIHTLTYSLCSYSDLSNQCSSSNLGTLC